MKQIYRTDDPRGHLCDTCEAQVNFPECMPDVPEEVEFGIGTGMDNITGCSNYSEC